MSIQDTCNQKKFMNKLRTFASKESEVQKSQRARKIAILYQPCGKQKKFGENLDNWIVSIQFHWYKVSGC